MLTKVLSALNLGLDVQIVEVEVDIRRGFPKVVLVGLPDTAVKESKERVETAIRNSNFSFPNNTVTINFAPANIKKEGVFFDLPVAIGILASSAQIKKEQLQEFVFLGELSLEGNIRKVSAVLPIIAELKKHKISKVVVPFENAREAALVDGIRVYPLKNLLEAAAFLNGEISPMPFPSQKEFSVCKEDEFDVDFSEIKGHYFVKRAAEIAVSGFHNFLMIGPPGCGKTMLAKRIPTIMPPMSTEEMLETTKIYSVSGLLRSEYPLVRARAFRSPHHSSSAIALIGGGAFPRPGEISLAHNGVLFLDELAEFHRDCLEALRQPLEEGVVSIARARQTLVFPSRFLFVAAMNPCPCGYYGDRSSGRRCHCTPPQIQRYRAKISGPLLDRIDIQVEVPKVPADHLVSYASSEDSASIRSRVEKARSIQEKRFHGRKIFFNSQMLKKDLKEFCPLQPIVKEILTEAVESHGLSGRAYDKIIKVARTVADLAGRMQIEKEDIIEALQYRTLDRVLWV